MMARGTTSSAVALQKLNQLASYGAIGTPAAAPDPKIYGVFGPSYASALANDPNEISHASSVALLGDEADRERADYSQALSNAHLGAAILARIQGKAATGTALANQLATEGKYNLFNAVHVNDDGTFSIDPDVAADSNNITRNERYNAARKDAGTAISDLYQAGIKVAPSTAAGYMSFDPNGAIDKGYGVFSPSGASYKDTTEREHDERADANDAVKAQADTIRAQKGGAADGGLSISVAPSMMDSISGGPIITQRLKGPAAEAYMASHGQGNAAPSNVPPNIAAMTSQGYKVQQAGNTFVVTSPRGQVAKFDAAGHRI